MITIPYGKFLPRVKIICTQIDETITLLCIYLQSLIIDLDRSSGADNEEEENLKMAVMSFINAAIKSGAGQVCCFISTDPCDEQPSLCKYKKSW